MTAYGEPRRYDPFYSLLGVSDESGTCFWFGQAIAVLSTPFWEFQLTIIFMRIAMKLLLSTPFWEFLKKLTLCGKLVIIRRTFYSLLGVSGGGIGIVAMVAAVTLSTPFWEFHGKMTVVRFAQPPPRAFYSLLGVSEAIYYILSGICFTIFLLPFGSFFSLHFLYFS